jgi:hypothetical protein
MRIKIFIVAALLAGASPALASGAMNNNTSSPIHFSYEGRNYLVSYVNDILYVKWVSKYRRGKNGTRYDSIDCRAPRDTERPLCEHARRISS